MGPEGEDGEDLSTGGLLAALAETPPSASVIPLGTVIADRFRVGPRLGAGGMGVVYRAHDTRLGRDVAIKVLLDDSVMGQQRLLREATAMAQLSHPNVVTAYDVGTWAHGVFIAMELVEGTNLRRWLDERERGWREVRDVFLAAGEGLRAMHAAGLVHRDFKPGNVLIDAAGRVRVTDLGLVRGAGAADESRTPDPDERAEARAILSEPLTTGTSVSGTPGYMAPEQLGGGAIDARADQYAFCVSLNAALGDDAPARLRAAVARGRSADPAARYPSLDPLLAALRYDPALARRRAAVAGALVALAALAAVGFMRRAAPCAGEATVASAWNAASRAAVRDAFERSGRPYAGDTFTRVAATLDGYAARLAATARTACEARLAASEACVARRREGLAALVTVLAAADGAVVDRAIQAADALDDVAPCGDARRLLAQPLPEDPATRAAIARLEPRLAALVAQEATGRYRDGAALAPDVVAGAREAGWPPLLARALSAQAALLIGLRDEGSAEVLRAAWIAAARAGDDELAAVDLGRLIWFVGVHQGKPAEAEPLFAAGEAALARAGERPLLRAVLLQQMGDVLIARGSYRDARRMQLEGLLLAEAGGEAAHKRALSWNGLAVVDRRLGELAEAEQAIRRSVALSTEALGPQHPQVGGTLMNLGAVLKSRGRPEEAIIELRRAGTILEAALGAESLQAAMVQTNLAEARHLLGRDAEALPAIERALAIKEKIWPGGHPSVASSLALRSAILVALGRPDDAVTSAERAAAIFAERLGPTHDDTAGAYLAVASAHAAAGHSAPARAALGRAKGGLGEGSLREDYHYTLGLIERLDGHKPLALAEQRAALALAEKRLGPGHPLLRPIEREIAELSK